jgi:outer membrane protein OmpA-like peptidoglycan-associated protein
MNISVGMQETHMANSMLESILGMFTPDMQQALASRLGESTTGVQSGIGAATATTLSGLADRASDSGFLGQITGLLGGGAGQNILASLPSIASGGPTGTVGEVINRFLPMVFGTQQGQIASAITQYAGLSSGSGVGLLKMAAPLVLGYFAKLHAAGSLTTSSLANALRAESPNLQNYLPANLRTITSGVASAGPARAAFAPVVAERTTPRWLVPLAIAGALLLGLLAIRSLMSPAPPVRTTATVTNEPPPVAREPVPAREAPATTTNTPPAAWAALGDMMRVKLPDGTELNVPSRGVEARLVSYLNDSSASVSDNTWFDFDRLLFDTGSATLQPASQEQLGNIAEILKAYPQVKIRIGGYTDNSGDPAANLQLSQQRADNVMTQLTQLGVDPSRMSAKGYGQEDAVADNSTEEGRQKNRRISLRVTDKPGSTA